MSKASALAQWLREYLANGPKPSKEVIDAARQQFGISELTVSRAWSDLKYKLNRELPPDEQVRDAHTIVGPWCSFRLEGHWFWGDKREINKPERMSDARLLATLDEPSNGDKDYDNALIAEARRRGLKIYEEDSAESEPEPNPEPVEIPIWKDYAMWLAFPALGEEELRSVTAVHQRDRISARLA